MNDIGVYRDRGTVSEKEVEAFQHEIGQLLPASYKELICAHNALRPVKEFFDFSVDGTVDSRDISFYGYGSIVPSYEKIQNNQQEADQFCRGQVICFAECANGDYVCFDYRHAGEFSEPSVVLLFHDQIDTDGKVKVLEVAPNFESFIELLYA